MNKTIRLRTKDVDDVPQTLCDNTARNVVASEISVDFDRLAHHYYFDAYEVIPPQPNPETETHKRFLSDRPDFRWRDGGLGAHKEARVGLTNRFGKAFCRWMLHDHFNLTFFAHLDHVLGAGPVAGANNYLVRRIQKGDTPDYLCAKDSYGVNLAEAKGRTSAIGFDRSDFQRWRDQFSRVAIEDTRGEQYAAKGYIVATRMAFEGQPRTYSTVYVEDPSTPGRAEAEEVLDIALRPVILRTHYSTVFHALRLPLYAEALRSEAMITEEAESIGVWEFRLPPLAGIRFIGGYVPPQGAFPRTHFWRWVDSVWNGVQLDLTRRGYRFLGLQLERYEGLRAQIRNGYQDIRSVEMRVEDQLGEGVAGEVPLPIGATLLRDSTLSCPLEYVRLVDVLRS